MRVHLLVCESQKAVEAGVSCGRQRVCVPLQPDGLQPLTHRPLLHTHLWYNGHTHLWSHPWLQHGGCRSVNTESERKQVGGKVRELGRPLSLYIAFSCPHMYRPVPSCPAQSPGVADEFIQHVEYLAEGGSLRSLSLPTIQHELVQHHGTVHGGRQAVAFLYRFNDLHPKVRHK